VLDGLTFGWRTAILLVPSVVMLAIAAGLWNGLHNRQAGRFLALFIVVLVGVLTPWMIGFAGFYDRWQALTFLPVSVPLLGPPLFWLYVRALTHGSAPPRAWLHLLPGAVEFAWQAVPFLLPLETKQAWADLSNAPANAVLTTGLVTSFAAYGRASVEALRRYRLVLARGRSDDGRFAARWLSRAMAAGAILAVFWSVYAVWDVVRPLGYSGLMGLYAGLAAIGLFLAIEGWRQIHLAFPPIDQLIPAAVPAVEERDWSAIGRDWIERVRVEGWYREPDLSLARVARLLGTNASYVSRAFNDGAGRNFSVVINGLRCDEVAQRLKAEDGGNILQFAIDAGFSSKASFNRAFRDRHGMTPQAYRRTSATPATRDAVADDPKAEAASGPTQRP